MGDVMIFYGFGDKMERVWADLGVINSGLKLANVPL